MSEKSFASLEPSLLARKGTAKPAMRPQAVPVVTQALAPSEDLGWNDMGEDHGQGGAEVLPLPNAAATRAASGGKPAVRRQIEAIAAHLARDPQSTDKQPSRHSALEEGRRAAFTLRLDGERHLKLRLACTMKNRSAQQIVTEALDSLLDAMPELDSLAAQLKQR